MSIKDLPEHIEEAMELGLYDNKTRLVYYSLENPPKCSVCKKDVQDEVFSFTKSGVIYCIDHSPGIPKTKAQLPLEAFI